MLKFVVAEIHQLCVTKKPWRIFFDVLQAVAVQIHDLGAGQVLAGRQLTQGVVGQVQPEVAPFRHYVRKGVHANVITLHDDDEVRGFVQTVTATRAVGDDVARQLVPRDMQERDAT